MYEKELYRVFHLLKNPLKQVSLDFCIRFLERLPDYDHKYQGDHADYMAWGKALYGVDCEKEVEGGQVWKWVRFYEAALSMQPSDPVDLLSFKNTKALLEEIDKL